MSSKITELIENFRIAKNVERAEDVYYFLDKQFADPGNGNNQIKDGYRFVVDSTGEMTALDWYNARISVIFSVTTLAGANITVTDHIGIVNSSHALIKKFNVKMGGVTVYECTDANHVTNIKNLLEYSQGYVRSQGTNEFFYLDTSLHAEEREFNTGQAHNTTADGNVDVLNSRVANYNKGFAARKAILGTSGDVNVEIPLNRYGFFEALHNEILPNARVEINFDIESDNDLIWNQGTASRVVIKKMELIIPRLVFNEFGKKIYASRYLKPRNWTYLREIIQPSESSTNREGNWRISSGVNKPRHVFIFAINDVKVAAGTAQANNKFLYNTLRVGGQNMTSCHLEIGSGKDYPEVRYKPDTEPTRVFRDVLKYVHANNYYAGDTLLNRENFGSLYQLIYFDLTKQPLDIKDGSTKLTFRYTLADVAQAYTFYALIMHEQDVEVRGDQKLTLRSM